MAKAVIDLSKMTPEAVKSQVLNKTAFSPFTIYPMFGAIGLLAFWVIFNAGWIFTLIGGLAFVGGCCHFCFNYFARYDFHRNAYFVRLRAESEAEAAAKLKMISEYLSKRNFEQGSRQVEKLQQKMAGFIDVLEAKFEEGEMAHARYLGVAQEVEKRALENLEQVVVELKAIDNIDPDYIEARWQELEVVHEANDGLDDRQIEESESLKTRMDIYDQHVKNAEDLLSLNEKAMTELDKLASKLATAKTSGDDVEAELARALERIDALGQEAERHWS